MIIRFKDNKVSIRPSGLIDILNSSDGDIIHYYCDKRDILYINKLANNDVCNEALQTYKGKLDLLIVRDYDNYNYAYKYIEELSPIDIKILNQRDPFDGLVELIEGDEIEYQWCNDDNIIDI